MATTNRRLLGAWGALFLPMALLLGSCSQPVPPEAIPPRILYYEPSGEDTLVMDEEGAERFVLHVQASADAEFWLTLGGERTLLADSSYIFVPADHGLQWPVVRQDSLVVVGLELEDAGLRLGRAWPVLVSITPGVEFLVEPPELDLEATVGDTLDFSMLVENAGGTVEYRWRVDDTLAGDDPQFAYIPGQPGEVLIQGHAWVPGTSTDLYHYWEVTVSPCEDQVPPVPVTGLVIGPGPSPGDLVVRFGASSDGPDGELARYELRFWDAPLPPEQWSTTNLVASPPATPGAVEEEYTLHALAPGRYFYMRVRAHDACGNVSSWSDLAEGKVAGFAVGGVVRDWETGEGVAGLQVRYGIGRPSDEVQDVTAADGSFHCSNVPYRDVNLNNPPGMIRDEALAIVGDWYDILDTRAINDSLQYALGTFRAGPTETGVYAQYLTYFRYMLRADVYGGDILHMQYPIAIHVEPFVYNGIDYEQLLRNAIGIWEEDTGLDLFTPVATAAEASLLVQYHPGEPGSGSYEILDRNPADDVPLLARIHWNASGQPGSEEGLQRVILHELGHALGPLRHSSEVGHVMATTNVVPRPSPDEVKMVRILWHMATREPAGFLAEN